MGRRVEQVREHYTLDNFRAWTDRSRRNLGVDTLDLVQLHCPPSDVIDADATYDDLDTLVEDGAIAAYGVSVETTDQALSAIARPHVASIQIILNAFRLKPLDAVLPAAAEAGVAIIARVPLASGLLSGGTTSTRRSRPTTTAPTTATAAPSTWARRSPAWTTETGVRAAQEFTALVARPRRSRRRRRRSPGSSQQPGVTTVIPGARNAEQARANAAAGNAGAAAGGGPRRGHPDLRPVLPRGRARPLVAAQENSLRSRARRC